MDQSTVPDLQLTYSSILNPAVKALEFIGQTSVVRDIEDEFPKEGLTVSFWVKTTDSQGDVMLFSYGARTGDNSRRLWLKNPSDIEVGFGSSGTGLTGVAINDGQWHNLAFTLKPSDNKHYGIQIFKDGVPAFRATGAISHPADKRLEPFGKLELGLGIENEKGLRGLLSEFCFWNRLLTEDEIITFMQVRREGSKEGLILYWALDSQASCGELTNGQFIESDLTFRSVTMFAVWSEISGAVYDLVVKNAEGRVVYEKKGITGLKETIENYYVNKQYVASVRAVLDGVPGEWSQPFVLRVLNLQKVNAAMEEDQAQNIWVEWQAVDQAQSYLVEKYENGGTQPEVITQTDKKSDLTALVRGNDWWQFDTKAFSEGSIGPPSDIIASGQTDVDFCYINDDENIPFFHVSWNRPLPLPEFFCVQIFSTDNSDVPIYEYICDNMVVSWRIDNPNVAESKKYKARIRGISQGIIGTWSVWKELSVYDLAVPRTRFAYSLEDKLLKLLWEDIRTPQQKEAGLAVSYKIDFYRDQEAVPYIEDYTTELCYAISQDRVLDDCEYRIKVSAWADGSQGGASSADEIDVPVITGFRFDFNDGKMYAEWSGIGNGWQGYVTVQKNGAVNPDYTEYVSGSESGKGSTAYTVSGAVDEDLYTAKIRAMDSGYITKYSQDNPTVTINKMVNPVITSSPCNTSEKSITAVWSFDDASLQGVSYNLELWDNELQRILLTSGPVTAKAYTFKDTSLISPGNIYNLRVQAQAGGSYGKWSSYMLVPCIGGIVIKSDPQTNISVSWSRINAAEAYKVSIYIDGVFKKTCAHTQQTLVTFSKSDTGLANGNTYKVKVDISVIKSGQTSQPAYEQIDRLKIEPSDNPHDGGDDGSHKEGDPVDTATGAYLYSHEDLGINCVEPLRFIVYYGTDVPTPQENNVYDGKPLGYRWNHAYNTKIVSLEDGKELGIIWGNGDVYKYGAPASNNSECQPVFAPRGYTLAVDEAGIYTLTKKDRYKYRFSKDGMLLSISSPCGNTVTLSYSGIRLDRIQFNENIYLEIGYNDKGLIEWVRDNGGRRVVYAYQGFNLTTITNTMDKYRTFEYDDNSHIKSITDENGHTFIKNVYDNEGRVTFQQDARAVAEGKSYGNAFSYAVAVEDNLEMIVTDFTDRSGNIAKFKSYKTSKCMKCAVYQLGEGTIRRIDRTYDGFNNILSETVYEGSESQYRDGMGNTTSFTYDQYNNRISETDPLGQSKYYSYDNNNNMQSETDKLGNTRYFYYEKGLMTKITDFLGRDTVITYDDGNIKGLVKTVKDALGNVFSFKYSGIWLSEMESPLGDITRFTNDSFGRPALEEISGADGVVLKTTYMEYDHAGNITQKRVVFPDQTPQDGYTHTFYFDNIGNNTGYTDPENNIITYRYDSNDFLKEIIYPANNGVNRKTVYEYDPSDNLIKAGYSPAVAEKFQYDRFQRILKYTDANNKVYQVDYSQVISEKEQDGSTYSPRSI
ncbi:MAG: DUF6531 domain-containing protein, partial [Clostridia bacterium]|nr:DUF6531 domain-containing protein [Clostridia bacterium]